MKSEYEIVLPPIEIFLNESVKTGWSLKVDNVYGKGRIDLINGLFYYPKPNELPYPGFPSPEAVNDTRIFKRLLMLWLRRFKNPLYLIFYKQAKKELTHMGLVCLEKHFLKPQFYSKPVREIYRLATLLLPELLAHIICAPFEWDYAYRIRLMTLCNIADLKAIIARPIRELYKLLKQAEALESSEDMKSKWKALRYALLFASISPKFRKNLKIIIKNISLTEFDFCKSDLLYGYKIRLNA